MTFEQRFIGGEGEAMRTSRGKEFQVEQEQPVQRPCSSMYVPGTFEKQRGDQCDGGGKGAEWSTKFQILASPLLVGCLWPNDHTSQPRFLDL